MRHVQAKRLHYARTFFLEPPRHAFKMIRRKELALLLQCIKLGKACVHLIRCHFPALCIFRKNFGLDLLLRFGFIDGNYIIRGVIHHMHRAGVGIKDDIQASKLITMYHNDVSPL